MLSLLMRDMTVITASNLLLRKFKLRIIDCFCFLFQIGNFFNIFFRDTEYYDYGHGEAQDTGYDSYGKSIKLPF